ncbi:type II toxin-antitoxin system RelE/ParE family toxin [Thalassospira xianhensis]|uniref:Plasmid stabilization protein n=1 Tax=Thalassospira xianhensis MCCC 1A02616 TaxID=1177929 RepID=A0A367UBB7_9PROT|nr:type II toxin-antitoxin system RelE/ParE family toxin [Thalassospira xianhensis]RCK05607.1 plasmid stabilization protein [Thalassospira xianhensis MCCC 1A02616]
MTSYRLGKLAEDDIRRLYRYGIETFGPQQADIYFDALFEQFDKIARSPTIYQSADNILPGYRRCVFAAHTIYYRMDGNIPLIMRILGRENPDLSAV